MEDKTVKAPEEKIKEIIEKYTPEVYKDTTKLFDIVSDYFPDEVVGKLLKMIVRNKAGIDVYNFKSNLSPNIDVSFEFNKLLAKVSKINFLPKEVVFPPLNLLCLGLGIDCSEFAPENTPKL